MLGPAVPMGLPAATGPIASGRLLLCGFAIRETSGVAVATVRFRDGVALGTSTPVIPIQLAAGESSRDHFAWSPVLFNSGLFVEVAAGAVEGAAWIISEATVDPASWAAFLAGEIFGGETIGGGIRP